MIKLVKVLKKEEQILHNLMQFYIYEFSQFIPAISLEENGAYKPFDLTPYWSSPIHHPFFIKKDEEFIGFVLVESATESEPNTILEFFIIRKYSGNGFGKIAANEIFTLFPGKWRVTQIEKNEPAKAFWRSTISKFTGGRFNETTDERRCTIQEFVTV
ncbi:GNAT family N-acetyltransferase [Neobacillus sp. SAB-20_R2A]|uniref:GNAT family N-acetyltransferase n=1 Tax=Neobacillus sp. SAB-20_R2A TaxID=3120519 RepID=UPI003C6E0F2A